MRAIWRVLAGHRDLRLVLSAGLISMTGDWILRVGLVYRVYALTGSTVASALTMASSFLPQVLLGAVAGVFADRWDRRRTMIVANLLLAVGLLPLLLVHGAGQVWIVFAVLLFEAIVQQFFSPAEQALLPRLVPDDQLITANAVSGQAQNLARLGGSGVGGVIAAAGGIAAVALADAASFVISAALIALVATSGRTEAGRRASSSFAHRVALLRADLADGLRWSARHRVVRSLMVFILVTSIGEGIMSTLFAPYVRHVLHGSSQAYGLIAAVQAIGGIAGGVIAASAGRRISAAQLLGWGAVAFGAVDLGIFLYPLGYVAVWPAAVGMVIVGVPGALTIAGAITLFQRSTDDALRGRVFGALGAVEGVAILVGTLCAGFLGQAVGIIPVLAVQGGAYVVAGFAMLVVLRADRTEPSVPPVTAPPAARPARVIDVPAGAGNSPLLLDRGQVTIPGMAQTKGMIVRTWSATADAAGAGNYHRYFDRTLLPELRKLPGFHGAYLLSREFGEDGTVELTAHTFWESPEVIRGFAGDDISVSVVEPEAQAMLLDFDRTAEHRTVLVDARG